MCGGEAVTSALGTAVGELRRWNPRLLAAESFSEIIFINLGWIVDPVAGLLTLGRASDWPCSAGC